MTSMPVATRRNLGLRPVTRGALTALAFAGSAAYALSFAGAADAQRWTAHAAAIGVAAGISWVVFGVLLFLVWRIGGLS
jgi:heme/copper-type cytochrome/quinol oxidase subunit 2